MTVRMGMYISIMGLMLAALYPMIPLLSGPEFAFGHGSPDHINWASQVSAGIREGILYPRWMPLSNGGYGSPATIFYPPLFYFLTGIVNLFVPSLTSSLKIITFAGFMLSGLGMYIFLRNFCGHKASVAGGIAYQLLPYHLLDLYIRVTLAETFAFAWLPFILHFLYKGYTENAFPKWIGLAFSYAGLVLTHLTSAYIFTFVILSFAIFLSLRRPVLFLRFTMASALGIAISAVYFVPMIFEREFVHIEWLTEVGFGDYKRNFLFMSENRGDPFKINLEQIVLLHAFLALIALAIYYRRKRFIDPSPKSHSVFSFFFGLSAFSVIISMPFTKILWSLIPWLPTIQFPWRWLMVTTLSVSILIGFTFDAFSFNDIKRDRFVKVCMALFHAIVIANFYLATFYMLTSKQLTDKDLEWILRYGGDVIEYRPIWLTDKKKDFSTEKWTPVVFNEGKGTVVVISWKSQSRLLKVTTATPSTIRVSTFYYPGWTALINGREIPIGIEKDNGAMLLSVPTGENTVLLEFRDTPLRRTAKWISIISLFAALAGLIATRLKKPLKS